MRVNILFGGKAGQGPNVLTHILGEALVKKGYNVFYARDYQSMIRGGHNFNVLTFSDKPVRSNDSSLDMIIALDESTEGIHKKNLKKSGVVINGKHENMYFAGVLFKTLGLDFESLEAELKNLKKRFDENIKEARQGYENAKKSIILQKPFGEKVKTFINGSQGISIGAIKSGLDVYYGYPMTPSTPVLTELAQKQSDSNILVLEMENEISVINSAIGSSITGAKAMVGTSGGGFDLMTEALSLAGMAEVPIVVYLAQRPGPATGVPTYNAQGDLNIARHSGHGEFPRVVLAPGDPKEAQELTSQAFYFSQKFKIPCIVIGDKHLGESFYTMTKDENPVITKSQKSAKIGRYNSYEKDHATGSATEDPLIVKANVEKRIKKIHEIERDAKRFSQYTIHGKNDSRNLIISWGSTKGAILDAICEDDLNCRFLQVLHIDPFPMEIKKELENSECIILIENNSTAQLGQLIMEKTGIEINEKNRILRYDGRPFLADEIKNSLKEILGSTKSKTAPTRKNRGKDFAGIKKEVEKS